jgi:hypothetical protein
VVKGQESYNLLKNSFSEIFSAIDKIIQEKKITVDNCEIPVEIFLGGDYKVIISSHNQFYAFCHVLYA